MARKVALFDTWRGRYGDHPAAISERMAVRLPHIERVWVLKDKTEAPDDVIAVHPFGPLHLYYLWRANYVFANNAMPFFWRKPSWCYYVQTWHGSGAYKKVGWDIQDPQFANSRRYLKQFQRDVDQWDVLITSNPSASKILPSAFRYSGPILEVGSPRSDRIVHGMASGEVERVRAELDISSSTSIILYAPTWRDVSPTKTDTLEIVEAVTHGLRPDEMLLVRAHPQDAQLTAYRPSSERVRNVSKYAVGERLLLAADVLITDYSSIFYDFAVTGRPMFFLCFDLEQYRDEVRGLYLNMETDLPGPVCHSVEELLRAMQTPPRNYSDWNATHCPHDDGGASDRVLDHVLAATSERRSRTATRRSVGLSG